MSDLQLGATGGLLELRRESNGSVRLAGRFPYNKPAVLSDGGRSGRPVKEIIQPGAFDYTIQRADVDIHLLLGHSFDKPLASKKAGTLTFRESAGALLIFALLTPLILRTAHAQDTIAMIEAGLVAGISPAFRLPPERTVPREEAEVLEDEPDDPARGMNRAIIRRILQAILVEFSLVTRPAYEETSIEATRAVQELSGPSGALLTARRWRA
jgi:uncharacterized protein